MSDDAKIIRQACLKAAASALSGRSVTAGEVCGFAEQLEDWVYAAGQAAPGLQAVVTELKATPVAGVPNCPKCGSEMWDNRADKRNPKAPDFKCKNKATCGHGIWN